MGLLFPQERLLSQENDHPCTVPVHDDFNVLHELPITFYQNQNKKTGLAILVGASDGDSVGQPLAGERLHEVRDRHWQCQLRGNGATATDAIIRRSSST